MPPLSGLLPRASRRRFSLSLSLSLPLFLLVLAGVPARAQLDLGSQDVPQKEIDGYMEPFYRVLASGLGAGRWVPAAPGNAGWEAGFRADLVPLPDRAPFAATDLSALPLFRLRAGGHLAGAGLAARGLIWKDPRIGRLATFGGSLAYGRDLAESPFPVNAALMAGWDRLIFSSAYTYRYRSSLSLLDRDVPGDYTLDERALGGGLMVSARFGAWRPYAQGWFEWVSGRFAYLYRDPRSEDIREVKSALHFPGARASLGLSWRGWVVEAGAGPYPFLEAGWSFIP